MSEARHILEDYRLDRVLASSARTTVFRAVDPATERPVVIKLIHPAGPTIQETNRSAFLYGAEVARTGLVSGLPRTVDFGLTHDDNAFLVMDMVDLAVPASALSGVTPQRMVEVASGAVRAVETIALSGATHLNLRTDNLLVTSDDKVILSGYGTAAFLAGAPARVWPDAGDPWVAPEMAVPDALRIVDLARADLFSLARVVCTLLGAKVETRAGNGVRVHLEPGMISNAAELSAVLTTALSHRPEERTVTVSDLGRLLAEASGGSRPGGSPALDPAAFETRAITAPVELAESPATEVDADAPREPLVHDPPVDRQSPVEDEVPEVAAPAPPADLPSRTVRWDVVVPLGGATVVVLLIAALLLGRSNGNQLVAAEAPPMPVPRPASVPTPEEEAEPVVNPLLEQAEQLLLDGDVRGARRLLGELPDQLVEGFNPEERELFDGLAGTIETEDRSKALSDLDGGLGYGSVKMLRRAVAGLADMPADERAQVPDLDVKLDRARRAIRLHNELAEAERTGAYLVVMDLASDMMRVLPDYSRSHALREKAAEALESAANDAADRRDFEEAIRLLTELESRWPNREGVRDRIALCKEHLLADEKLESVLREARAAAQAGDPEAGLAALDAETPKGPYVIRFESMRRQLESQLVQMDAAVPTITLDPGFEAAFKKNQTVLIPLTVIDDLRVERVSVWVGAGGSSQYREVALETVADGQYPAEVGPEMHGNRSFYFYVEAADPTGHVVYLGSPEAPYEVERKKWFNKVIP